MRACRKKHTLQPKTKGSAAAGWYRCEKRITGGIRVRPGTFMRGSNLFRQSRTHDSSLFRLALYQTDRQTDQRPTPTGRRRTDRLGRDTPPSPTNHTLTTPHRHHRRHKREPTRTQTAGPHSTHATRQALHILVQARARIHSPITRQRHGHTPGPTLGHAHHHPPPPAQQQATHRLTRVHGNLQSR